MFERWRQKENATHNPRSPSTFCIRKLQGGSFKRIPASQKTKIVLSGIIILFSISYFSCKVILATKIIKIVKALKYPYYIKCLVKKCFLNKNKKKLLPANNDISV